MLLLNFAIATTTTFATVRTIAFFSSAAALHASRPNYRGDDCLISVTWLLKREMHTYGAVSVTVSHQIKDDKYDEKSSLIEAKADVFPLLPPTAITAASREQRNRLIIFLFFCIGAVAFFVKFCVCFIIISFHFEESDGKCFSLHAHEI